MGRTYSPQTFIRQAPNRLLRRYLATLGLEDGIPWDDLAETQIAPLLQVMDRAAEGQRRRLESDFRDIYDLAEEGGVLALMDAGRGAEPAVDLALVLGENETLLERAFHVFLDYPTVFRTGHGLHSTNRRKPSCKRPDLPPEGRVPLDGACGRLTEDLRAYFAREQGRGRNCVVDHICRGDRHYWVAHLEDYARGVVAFDEQGQIERRVERSAFEVALVYSCAERSLDTYCPGGSRVQRDLFCLFCRAVLAAEVVDPGEPPAAYRLQSLLDGGFEFVLEPGGAVESAKLVRLQVEIMGSHRERVMLEVSPSAPAEALRGLLDDVLTGLRATRDMVRVTQAGIRLVFRNEGSGRRRSLTFDVKGPNGCTLRSDPRHEIAKDLLRRWGLDVSGLSADDPGLRGRPAQYQYILPER